MPVPRAPFRAAVLSTALVLAATAAPPPAGAVPEGWTEPAPLPATTGVVNQVSETAPDGADAVVWVAATDDGVALRGRVRGAGSDTWRTVTPLPRDQAQELVIAADAAGDFWIAWTEYAGPLPEVWAVRLRPGPASFAAPQQVFHDEGFGHGTPYLGVSDAGTVFVAASSQSTTPSSPPVYRAAVGVKRPGRPWDTRFVSPAGGFAIVRSLAVSPNGHAVVGFVQGYDLADKLVRAATRPRGADSPWTVADLSVAGDSQTALAAIGPDGTAAMSWNSPSTGFGTVRLSTTDVTTDAGWSSADPLATGPDFHDVRPPVVTPDGAVTGYWYDGGSLWSRVLDGTLGDPTRVTPDDVRSDLRGARVLSTGLTAVLHQSFDPTTNDDLGLRLTYVDHGVPQPEQVITTVGDGEAEAARIGVDAADLANVVWQAGESPTSVLTSAGQPPFGPVVVTAPHFGEPVVAASLRGTPRVGKVLTCRTGYVVEARRVGWRWFRDGDRIRGAGDARYRLRAADDGSRVRCSMVAVGLTQSTILDSPARRVR